MTLPSKSGEILLFGSVGGDWLPRSRPTWLRQAGVCNSLEEGGDPSQHPSFPRQAPREFGFVNNVKLLPLRGAAADEERLLPGSPAAFSLHLQRSAGTWSSPGHGNGSRQMGPAIPMLLPELPRCTWLGWQELRTANLTLLALCHTGDGREQPSHPPAGFSKEVRGHCTPLQENNDVTDQPSKAVFQELKQL